MATRGNSYERYTELAALSIGTLAASCGIAVHSDDRHRMAGSALCLCDTGIQPVNGILDTHRNALDVESASHSYIRAVGVLLSSDCAMDV